MAAGLDYLNSLIQWDGDREFSIQPMVRLCAALGNPQDQISSIHVAGTNGKGSVSAMIAACLAAEGARVGLATSPHLVTPTERIVIDGREITLGALDELLLEVKAAACRAKLNISYFEALMAASFLAFRGLDWSVVEVGLGGRLDASNVIAAPRASVITSIGLDHQKLLGYSLSEIAAEKAGIIKQGAPLFVGQVPDQVFSVISRAAKNASVSTKNWGRDFQSISVDHKSSYFSYLDLNTQERFEYKCGLLGPHQGHNSGLAIAVARELKVAPGSCCSGIGNVQWPGRLEPVVIRGKSIWLDGAHNPMGIEKLVDFIKSQSMPSITLGLGLLDRIGWQDMVDCLMPVVGSWVLASPPTERRLPSSVLEGYLRERGVECKNYDEDYDGFIEAVVDGTNSRETFITGSFYLIGIIRDICGLPFPQIWSSR